MAVAGGSPGTYICPRAHRDRSRSPQPDRPEPPDQRDLVPRALRARAGLRRSPDPLRHGGAARPGLAHGDQPPQAPRGGNGPLRREPHRARPRLVRRDRPRLARTLGGTAEGIRRRALPDHRDPVRVGARVPRPGPHPTRVDLRERGSRQGRRRPQQLKRGPVQSGPDGRGGGSPPGWRAGPPVDLDPHRLPGTEPTRRVGAGADAGRVPVASTPPASSGKAVVRYSTMAEQPKMGSAVVESWRRTSFTEVRTRNDPGSGTSSDVTRTGPSAHGCRTTCPW